MQYEIWVPPGACYNSIGYWHVPGARVVYERGGATRSFGIASLISWRGDWYLVHLGAYSRNGAGRHRRRRARRARACPARRAAASRAGGYPAVAEAPCTDPVSCPLVARTSQITVRVPACQATESG